MVEGTNKPLEQRLIEQQPSTLKEGKVFGTGDLRAGGHQRAPRGLTVSNDLDKPRVTVSAAQHGLWDEDCFRS